MIDQQQLRTIAHALTMLSGDPDITVTLGMTSATLVEDLAAQGFRRKRTTWDPSPTRLAPYTIESVAKTILGVHFRAQHVTTPTQTEIAALALATPKTETRKNTSVDDLARRELEEVNDILIKQLALHRRGRS